MQEKLIRKNGDESRKSGISRFVGFGPHQEEAVREFFANEFKNEAAKFSEKYEKIKSKEEVQMIKEVINELNNLLAKYSHKPLAISPEHIHILDIEKLPPEKIEILRQSKENGAYHVGNELITIYFWSKNTLKNLKTLVHELIHFYSFQSITIKDASEAEKTLDYSIRRVGFTIRTRKGDYAFNKINEAITEELTKKFFKRNLKNIKSLSYLHEDLNTLGESDVAYIEAKDNSHFTLTHFSYPEEREILWKIIEDVQLANKEKFNSKEEIFDIFAKAAMNGRLVEIAKLIELTYGAGSFRRIGTETKDDRKM